MLACFTVKETDCQFFHSNKLAFLLYMICKFRLLFLVYSSWVARYRHDYQNPNLDLTILLVQNDLDFSRIFAIV